MMLMTKPPISADSHITEHPDTYRKYIDPALRDRAPHLVHDDAGGDLYVIPDLTQGALPMGLIAAAGKRPEDIRPTGRFEEWHRGGWDPEARLADQERDGVSAEVLYPTVGLVLCRHPDLDYKQACMDAYNRWLAEYCSAHPDRLLGVGQTAVRTPADGIEDLRRIKALGLRGVMLPSRPGQADWDSPIYDELFEATLDLARLPSEYFREHVYLTFQDDWPAFQMTGLLNPRRLMWANDFPHSDSTWPWSQELLAREAACLTEAERELILHDNAAELYGI